MTEVSKVQQTLSPAERARLMYDDDDEQQDVKVKEPVVKADPKKDDGKGTVVQSNPENTELSPEEKAAKQKAAEEAKKAQEAEIARAKAEAEKAKQQAEVKPEPKPEPKVEVKPEPKPAPKVEVKPEPKPAPKVEVKPEPKPEPKVEVKPEEPKAKEGPVAPEVDDKYKKYFKNSTAQLQKIYEDSKGNPEKQEAVKQILDYKLELAKVAEGEFTLSVDEKLAENHRLQDKESRESKFANAVADSIAKTDTTKWESEDEEKADKRLEKVKNHQAYLTRKEYRAAMKQAKEEDGVSRKEFKKTHSYIKSKKVRDYVKQNFMTEDGEIDMQKWKDHNFQYAGADFKVNYGINREKHNGALAGHELDQVKTDHNFNKRQAKQLMTNAGFEVEKSDKGKKVALAGLAALIPGAGLGAGVGALAGSMGTLTAEASAQVVDLVTKEIIKEAYDIQTKALTIPGMAIGGVAGAVAGSVIAMISKAINYEYDGQRDLLNGHSLGNILDVQDEAGNLKENYKEMITKDFTEGLKGNDLKHGQLAATAMISLIEAGIPPKSIEYAMRVARGTRSGEHLNLEEMAKGVEALKDLVEKGEVELLDNQPCHEGEVPPVDDKPVDDKPVDDKPVDDKPVDDKPVDDKPVDDKPVDDKPVDDKPVDDKPVKEERFKDGKSTDKETVTVMNGESFRALAKKYGVSVEEIKELNKDKIHSFKDCDDKVHTFFRVGAKIVLPAGADQKAVEENQKVDAKVEIGKYTKAVTSDKNIKKLVEEDCARKARAQGDQVYKLYINAQNEIWNLILQLKSSVLSPEGREKAEARYRELTGMEPPKPEVLAKAPEKFNDFKTWVDQARILDWHKIVEDIIEKQKSAETK